MNYRKGGKGALLRCFVEGIESPEKLAAYKQKANSKEDLDNLCCPQCDCLMGVPMIYKDGRLAFRMLNGYFHKKLIK